MDKVILMTILLFTLAFSTFVSSTPVVIGAAADGADSLQGENGDF